MSNHLSRLQRFTDELEQAGICAKVLVGTWQVAIRVQLAGGDFALITTHCSNAEWQAGRFRRNEPDTVESADGTSSEVLESVIRWSRKPMKRVNISMSEEDLLAIDAAAAECGENRSEYVVRSTKMRILPTADLTPTQRRTFRDLLRKQLGGIV